MMIKRIVLHNLEFPCISIPYAPVCIFTNYYSCKLPDRFLYLWLIRLLRYQAIIPPNLIVLIGINHQQTTNNYLQREPQLKDCLDQVGLCACSLGVVLLLFDVQPPLGSNIHRQVTLGCLRTPRVNLNEPPASPYLSTSLSASVSILTSLSNGLWTGSVSQANPFHLYDNSGLSV